MKQQIQTTIEKDRSSPVSPGGEKISERIARWASTRAVNLILFGILFLGVGLLVYPSFADYWNSFHQTRAVASYAEKVADMNTQDYEKILDKAREYNRRLAERGLHWELTDEEKEEYENELDISGTGIMGYIKIQKIDVMLPIYHGTDSAVLQISIGHLEPSSLPVGGESSHCMLSGHRGLPSAKLFTDLDQLKEGDTFTMTVLNETLTYEVDHIWIVEPWELEHLDIEDGRDYCTLITCTPYGINSHRLLVRGHRIKNINGNAMVVADAIQIQPIYIAPFVAIPILIALLIYVLISTGVKRQKIKSLKEDYINENGLTEPEIETEDREGILEAVRSFRKKRKQSAERGSHHA